METIIAAGCSESTPSPEIDTDGITLRKREEACVGTVVNIHRHAKCEIAFLAKRERDQVSWEKPIRGDQLVSFTADIGRSISIYLVLKGNFSGQEQLEC